MLTPIEICRQTGINRSALERYLAESEIRKILGREATPPKYLESSLPMFRRIAEMHKNKEVTPKTLAATLERELRNPDSEIRNSQTEFRNPKRG